MIDRFKEMFLFWINIIVHIAQKRYDVYDDILNNGYHLVYGFSVYKCTIKVNSVYHCTLHTMLLYYNEGNRSTYRLREAKWGHHNIILFVNGNNREH